jgi:hypothetical protein
MQKYPWWLTPILLALIAALAYLPFVGKFGYTFDDWYLMWSAKVYGPQAFHALFSIDRPLRGYVMEAAYALFGENPLWYNLSAWGWRVLSGLAFLRVLLVVWPQRPRETFGAALIFLLYPGFLSQFNGIDYQSQSASLAAAMVSIALTVHAVLEASFWRKVGYIVLSIVLGWIYLGLVEYEIGFEFLRLGLVFVLVWRQTGPFWKKALQGLGSWLPYSLITLGFGYWRVFVFVSERRATDTDIQFGQFLSAPFRTLILWIVQTAQDALDVLFMAWVTPLRQIIHFVSWQGVVLTLAGLGLALYGYIRVTSSDAGKRPPLEMLVLGFLAAIIGLIPIVMVNREVAFPYFSRYALISAPGVALFFAGGLAFLGKYWRVVGFSILAGLALLLHQANSTRFAFETNALRQFWWQVSWRVPQLEKNTTLAAYWPVGEQQEDYFVWGPANLIYYPRKLNEKGMQPGVFAIIATNETVERVLARDRQQYDNRRTIITYANYRNILVFIQNQPSECVRAIDGTLPEISRWDTTRFKQMAPFSEIEHILTDAPQQTPPLIVFGPEPEHTWCYYYEKASLARQSGDWEEVRRLGNEARAKDVFYTQNLIEWTPFIQAYAIAEDFESIEQISAQYIKSYFDEDECKSLLHPQIPAEIQQKLKALLCQGAS